MPMGISGMGVMRDDIRRALEIARSWQGGGGGLNASLKDQGFMIPPFVVERSHGICFLFFIRAGFLWSGEIGTGFVMSKLNRGTPQQRWSAPTAITGAGVGWGLLIGAQKVSHVVVLNNKMAVGSFSSAAKVNIGGDVSVALGPVGRSVDVKVEAGTSGVAATYSYSYAQGAYAGMSLDGMAVSANPSMNQAFYGQRHSPKDLIKGQAGLDAWQFCTELAELYQVLDTVLNSSLRLGNSAGSRIPRPMGDGAFADFGRSSRERRRPSVGVDLLNRSGSSQSRPPLTSEEPDEYDAVVDRYRRGANTANDDFGYERQRRRVLDDDYDDSRYGPRGSTRPDIRRDLYGSRDTDNHAYGHGRDSRGDRQRIDDDYYDDYYNGRRY